MSQENPQPSTPQTRTQLAQQLWMKHLNHGNARAVHTHVVGAQFAAPPTVSPPGDATSSPENTVVPEIAITPQNTPHPSGLTTEQLNYISGQRNNTSFPVRTKPPVHVNSQDLPHPPSPPMSSNTQPPPARGMPGMSQMMKNIANTAGDVVKQAVQGGPIVVPEEIQKMRFDMCLACEFYDKDQGRCTKCGCFMKAKTNLAAATCPVQKWGKHTE